jgi:heme ABC exporter ATP-binding subunit CcmA
MPSSEPLIRCAALERRFGERRALAGLDLEVAGGETVVVTGPNGAGKTTLLRVLATVLRPTSGEVTVGGHSLPREAMRARPAIGYIAHEPLVYPGLTADENLTLFAALYDVDAGRVGAALELVGLGHRADDLVAEFSRGMLARLAIARATLHDPELLLLDEPTAGLDSDGHTVLAELLERRRGRTALIATHEPERFAEFETRRITVDGGTVTG